MKKVKTLLAVLMIIAVMLSSKMSLNTTMAEEDKMGNILTYNSAENFSDLGSDFWKYYFINSGEYGEFTPLVVNGTGLFGEYYPDGSFGYEYRYCVSPNDFTSNEYHQYLEIWGGVYIHPGFKADTVLSFVAPVDGIINIDAVIKAMGEQSDGVKIYTSLNNSSNLIQVNGEDFILHNKRDTEYSIRNLEVKRGDEIFFRVNCNNELSFDKTYFSPTVTYVSYDLPEDLKIEISDTSLTVPVGGIRLLEVSMNVNLGTELDYKFTSSNESVLKVLDNGLVYALNEGTSTVTVSVKEGNYSVQCVVNVESEPEQKGTKGGCGGAMKFTSVFSIGLILLASVVFVAQKR